MPTENPSKQPKASQPASSVHFVESVRDLYRIEHQGMPHSSAPHPSQNNRFPPSHTRTSSNLSNLDPMHANPLPFLSPQPFIGYSADPQPLLDPRTVPLNSYNNPNSSATQVVPQGAWFATPQSHGDGSASSLSPSITFLPDDTHESASPASDGAPSNASLDSSRQDANGPADPSAGFSFIALPNADPPRKRPRRKYEEIERVYGCNWESCTKAYGTLNHLNQHIQCHGHGPKRTPKEFKDVRKLQRSVSRTPSNPEFRGTPSQPATPQGGAEPGPSTLRHTAGSDVGPHRPSHRDLPSIMIPGHFDSVPGSQSADEPPYRSQQLSAMPEGPSSGPLGPQPQYGAHGRAPAGHVLGQGQPYEHNQALQPNLGIGDASHLSRPVPSHLTYHQVDGRSISQEAHGYGNESQSHVPPAQNPVPVSYQVSAQELWAQQQQPPQPQPRAFYQSHHHRAAYPDQPLVDRYPVMATYNNPPQPPQGHDYYAAGDVARYGRLSQRPTQPYDAEHLSLPYTPFHASAGPSRSTHIPQDHQYPIDNHHVSMGPWLQPPPGQEPCLPPPSTATSSSRMGPLDPSSTLLTPFRQKDPPPP